MKRLTLLSILLLSIAIAPMAQVIRPIAGSYMLQFGSSQLEDTYLTPLKYKGTRFGLACECSQAMKFSPENWIMRFDLDLNFAYDKNPAKTATMVDLFLTADWNMMRRWRLPYSLSAGVGGGPQLTVGALYRISSGNNPVSAKVSATLNATGFVAWNCKLGRLPITLRYQATLPVIGAFFSPDYGELYYQIYLGDRKRLVHPAVWGKYFFLDNLVTADLHLGNVSLRLGYRGRIFSSKVSGIISNDFSHSLVIGVTTDWITLGQRSTAPQGEIIRAY